MLAEQAMHAYARIAQGLRLVEHLTEVSETGFLVGQPRPCVCRWLSERLQRVIDRLLGLWLEVLLVLRGHGNDAPDAIEVSGLCRSLRWHRDATVAVITRELFS